MTIRRGCAVFLCLLLLAGFSACGVEPIAHSGYALNTWVQVTIYDGASARPALERCLEALRDLENQLSRTVEGSDIYRVNHAGGAPTRVDPETAALLHAAIRYGELSDGLFDVTIAPLVQLWDDTAMDRVPGADDLAAAAARVDYRKLRVEGDTVTLPEGMAVDLGGIAKGYICDRMADILREDGVKSAVIDLGGNVYVLGEKSPGTAFRTGIQKPFAARGEILGVVSVRDRSVVSSGVYERYREVGGRMYHHILNPRDGMPVENGLYAVSILAERSVDADALSTVCFVLGEERARGVVEGLPGIQAIFLRSDGSVGLANGPGGEVEFEARQGG